MLSETGFISLHIKTAVIILTIKRSVKKNVAIFGQKGQKVPGFIIGLKVCTLGQTVFRLKALLSYRFKRPQHWVRGWKHELKHALVIDECLLRCTCWVSLKFGSRCLLWQMESLIHSCSVGSIWSIHFPNHTCCWEVTQHISENCILRSCYARSATIFFFSSSSALSICVFILQG